MKTLNIDTNSEKTFTLTILGIPLILFFIDGYLKYNEFFGSLGYSIGGAAIFSAIGFIVHSILKFIFRTFKIKRTGLVSIIIFFTPIIITVVFSVGFIIS